MAALAAACRVPVQELIYECAGIGEWCEHASREGGRAGWLMAATMLHGTVKEGWFEEGCNQKQWHHPAGRPSSRDLIPEVSSTPIRT